MFKPCRPCCNHINLGRVQHLSAKGKSAAKAASSKEMYPDDGAVLFGKSRILIPPRTQNASIEALHPDLASDDSGLGTSIQSSTTTQDLPSDLDIPQPNPSNAQPSLSGSGDDANASLAASRESGSRSENGSPKAVSIAFDPLSRPNAHPPTEPIIRTVVAEVSQFVPRDSQPSRLDLRVPSSSKSKTLSSRRSLKRAWQKLVKSFQG